jgi:hypothetical protein
MYDVVLSSKCSTYSLAFFHVLILAAVHISVAANSSVKVTLSRKRLKLIKSKVWNFVADQEIVWNSLSSLREMF